MAGPSVVAARAAAEPWLPLLGHRWASRRSMRRRRWREGVRAGAAGGERVLGRPAFRIPKQDCGFTQWLDKKFPEKATVHMNYLTDKVDSLEQQVDNLKCELEELRRRHQKRSTGEAVVSHGAKCPCGKIPCDVACCNQDEKPRPSQIRRLAKAN